MSQSWAVSVMFRILQLFETTCAAACANSNIFKYCVLAESMVLFLDTRSNTSSKYGKNETPFEMRRL